MTTPLVHEKRVTNEKSQRRRNREPRNRPRKSLPQRPKNHPHDNSNNRIIIILPFSRVIQETVIVTTFIFHPSKATRTMMMTWMSGDDNDEPSHGIPDPSPPDPNHSPTTPSRDNPPRPTPAQERRVVLDPAPPTTATTTHDPDPVRPLETNITRFPHPRRGCPRQGLVPPGRGVTLDPIAHRTPAAPVHDHARYRPCRP